MSAICRKRWRSTNFMTTTKSEVYLVRQWWSINEFTQRIHTVRLFACDPLSVVVVTSEVVAESWVDGAVVVESTVQNVRIITTLRRNVWIVVTFLKTAAEGLLDTGLWTLRTQDTLDPKTWVQSFLTLWPQNRYVLGHFGWSVLGPNCPGSELSGYRQNLTWAISLCYSFRV